MMPGKNEGNNGGFLKLVNNRLKFNFYLMKEVPSAYFSGVRIVNADDTRCIASVPFRWLTRNPFRSMYFATMSMAAELTTGILAMNAIWKRTPPVSMLITGMDGKFYKKATGKVLFTCNDGHAMKQEVKKAIEQGQPVQFTALSTGRNAAGEIVAEFYFTWSFKPKEK